jgi:hypothetical protein
LSDQLDRIILTNNGVRRFARGVSWGDDIALKNTAWDGDDLGEHNFGVMVTVSPSIQLGDSGGRHS